MNECLICKSKQIRKIQKITTQSIDDLYKAELNITVNSEFKDLVAIEAFKCEICELVFFSPLISGSEGFYENLQKESNSYYSADRPEFYEAIKFIKPSDKVLEIGAGSAFFAKILNNCNYVGLEFNQEAIEKSKAKGIKLLKFSIEDFSKFNINQFDVVCSFHVLEHVQDPYSFIESSVKSIRKGGKFICAVPCLDSFYTKNLNHVLNIPPHHVTRWSTNTLEFICRKFDLSLEYVYHEEIKSQMDYFETRVTTILLNALVPKKTIFINPKRLKFINKVVKKINRTFKIYTLFSNKGFIGRNVLIVATKN